MDDSLQVFRAVGGGELSPEQQAELEKAVAKDVERRTFLLTIPEVLKELERFKYEAISVVFSVPVQGVLEHQISVLRRLELAKAVVENPETYTSTYFNGSVLPVDLTEAQGIARVYIAHSLAQLSKIEEIEAHFSERVSALTECKSVSDLRNVRW